MGITLTSRDNRLLVKCAVARWLTTGQIRQLFFPGLTTPEVARRRLRLLTCHGYLQTIRPHQSAEALFALGPAGRTALQGRGLEFNLERTLPKQLEHLVGINDIRVLVERCGLRVRYFMAAWELPSVGWRSPLIPDAVFEIHGKRSVVFLFEYDRGTMAAERLRQKIRAYQHDLEAFPFDAVLIVCDAPQRLSLLHRHLAKHVLPERRFLGTCLSDIRNMGIFTQVFVDLSEPEPTPVRISLRELFHPPLG